MGKGLEPSRTASSLHRAASAPRPTRALRLGPRGLSPRWPHQHVHGHELLSTRMAGRELELCTIRSDTQGGWRARKGQRRRCGSGRACLLVSVRVEGGGVRTDGHSSGDGSRRTSNGLGVVQHAPGKYDPKLRHRRGRELVPIQRRCRCRAHARGWIVCGRVEGKEKVIPEGMYTQSLT